jgi:serine/threonine-protein kinase HipA
MRKAKVLIHGEEAGVLEEVQKGSSYLFRYRDGYESEPLSLTMPLAQREYRFAEFPPFFDGLLPEGVMLEALVRKLKIDRNDRFSQLLAVGRDLVGAVTVEEAE